MSFNRFSLVCEIKRYNSRSIASSPASVCARLPVSQHGTRAMPARGSSSAAPGTNCAAFLELNKVCNHCS